MLFNRLREIRDFGMAQTDPSSVNNASNLVELKSRQLHELFVITVFFSGFVFTAQDL